jgi:hypothetical protein
MNKINELEKKALKTVQLIEAAPELLEACEAAYEQERCVCEDAEIDEGTCLACYLGSVIEKARGENYRKK